MHYISGFALLFCVFVYVSGETCTVNNDCQSTTCGTGSRVICQHPDGQGITSGGGLCTCEQDTNGECVMAADCNGNGAPDLKCPDSARHCYDNKCICDRFPIGGK